MLWVTLRNLPCILVKNVQDSQVDRSTHLCDECHQLPKMLYLFIWIRLENFPDTVVMVPLLQKLFLVGWRISLDEVLQLRKICGQKYAASHAEKDLWREN